MDEKIIDGVVDNADVILQDKGIDMMSKIMKKARKSGTAVGMAVGFGAGVLYFKVIKPAIDRVKARKADDEIVDADVVESDETTEE